MSSIIFCAALYAYSSPAMYYIDPAGSDANAGSSKDSAFGSCYGALRKIAGDIRHRKFPVGGWEVIVTPGKYKYNATTACCFTPSCHNVTFAATEASPIVIRGDGGDSGVQPVFDGSLDLNISSLAAVTNETVLALINPAAKGKVKVMHLPGGVPSVLQWGAVPLTPSVWPNQGLGYVRRVFDAGAVYAQGRTKGLPPRCNSTYPCGGNISLSTEPTGDWALEFAAGAGFGGASVTGYFSNDWYHESHPIARVRSTPEGNTTLMFTDYSRYGICEALEDVKGGCGGTAPGRFTVHGLLSEVDSEGEYWYDHASEQLYIYPPTDMHLDGADVAVVDRGGSVLTAWHEGTFATLVNTSYVTIRDITVQSSVETLVTIAGCYRTTVGGCTLKNAAGGISLSGGHNNRIIGNDIYDVDGGHVSSSGDESSTAASLVPTNNVIENNHITQVYLAGSTWSVQIKGVGDRFTRNLVYGKFSFALLDMDPRACKK